MMVATVIVLGEQTRDKTDNAKGKSNNKEKALDAITFHVRHSIS